MNLAEYVLSKGVPLAKKGGEEWAGPCPVCGGKDRFVVFETGGRKGITVPGRFFCRQCEAKGDFISWLIDREGLTIREAMEEGGQGDKNSKCRPMSPKTEHREPLGATASEAWSAQAERVLSSARQGMSLPDAAAFFRDKRGLSGATCRALGFGWQASDSFTASELWGLPEGKKIVVPAGAVLPVQREGRTVHILVRRSKPYTPSGSDKPMRFHEVRGGAGVPFLCGPSGAPLVVVESILCAASIFQASGGTVAAVALCGATKGKGAKLDRETVEAIRGAAVVLVAGDRDEAGEKVLASIREVRPDAFPYTVPGEWNGKSVSDPNDLLQAGGDRAVKGWLLYGIKQAGETSATLPSAKPHHFTGNEETQETGDQEHGGEAGEPGPDEFAAHVAQVRGAWPDGPPMVAQDMPDWSAFCVGWWQDCFRCPYYDGNPNGSPCTLWEAAFPGKVRWYPPSY